MKWFGNRVKHRGHMLLVVIVMTTLISIMTAMAIQPIRTSNIRMKEQLLIYRGEHLAQGIRRFYFKNRRFPFTLEELMDADPRFIRKLYKDPMTDDGKWDLVYLSATDRSALQGLSNSTRGALENSGVLDNDQNQDGQDNNASGDTSNTRFENAGPSAFEINTQQITGLRSKSKETGFKVYMDSQIYNDWIFSALPQRKEANLSDLVNGAAPKQP